MLARVCRAGVSPAVTSLLKTPVTPKPLLPRIQASRLFASDGRSSFTRSGYRRTTRLEDTMAPAGETAINLGKATVAGAAVAGIGALCYYGAGLSSLPGAIDYAGTWPQYVKDRIKTTYLYFGGSVLVSAASAAMCLRSPAVMNLVMRQGWVALGCTLAATIGSGMVVLNIPYKEGFNAKQVAWLVHTGIIGAILAPLYLIGGPLVLRAAWYTAGVVGGLSAVAVCAPNEKFLNMGGPLAIGLGVVFASAIGSMFLPPTVALGSALHSVNLYGGLILFSAFLLYDTQKIIKNAQEHPMYYNNEIKGYDPINNAISVYLDAMNIFVRIFSILMGNNKRK